MPDGRRLFYDARGAGERLVCHPGGPGFSGAYLGELGGLDRSRAIVALDPRGTGQSDPPSLTDAYALDDYVADPGLLQAHLGLSRVDLGGSHVVMISHPKEVAEVVMTAARTCAVQSA